MNEDSAGGGDFSEQLSPLIFQKICFLVFLEHGGVASLKNVSVVG